MENFNFPFRKLRFKKYLTLEVMMNVEYMSACNHMHHVNKATRTFLEKNACTIRNGFINDGLIEYLIESKILHMYLLEKLYFKTLKRNIDNRKLKLVFNIRFKEDFYLIKEIVKWLKAQ